MIPAGLHQMVKRWIAQALADFEGAFVSTGAVSAASVTAANLTSGRVATVGTAGLIQDDSDLTFSGSTLTMTTAAVGSGGLTSTGAITPTGGVVGTGLGRVFPVPIGAVAYGSLGTNTTPVAGTIYAIEVFLPANKSVTGIAFLNGGTVGTDNAIVALANSAGTVVATSALAGVVTAGANTFQAIPFTAPYAAVGPSRHWILLQFNGTTTRFRSVAVDTYLPLTSATAGVFGTLASITPPTTTAADAGPFSYLY